MEGGLRPSWLGRLSRPSQWTQVCSPPRRLSFLAKKVKVTEEIGKGWAQTYAAALSPLVMGAYATFSRLNMRGDE